MVMFYNICLGIIFVLAVCFYTKFLFSILADRLEVGCSIIITIFLFFLVLAVSFASYWFILTLILSVNHIKIG